MYYSPGIVIFQNSATCLAAELESLPEYGIRRPHYRFSGYATTVEPVHGRRRRRRFDLVLVWKLDHMGRSLRHLVNTLATLAELEALGIALFSMRESLDLSELAGRLIFGMGRLAASMWAGLGSWWTLPGFARFGPRVAGDSSANRPSKLTNNTLLPGSKLKSASHWRYRPLVVFNTLRTGC